MDKREPESEERLIVTLPASFRSSLVGGSSGKGWTITRDDISPEKAASFSRKYFFGPHLQ